MSQFTVLQCLNSQIHLGHKPSEWNPNIASFLLGYRDKDGTANDANHIFDVSKSCWYLRRALRFASHTAINLGSEGTSNILFMGKSPKKIGSLIKKNNPYEQILKTSALSVGASCFNGDADTWVNGTFTNWQEYLLQNQNKLIKNSNNTENNVRLLDKYTPGSFERQYQKYVRSADNLNQLTPEKDTPTSTTDRTQQLISSRLSLPSLIFAIGISGLEQPLREAHKAGIPIIAVVDSDSNPKIQNQWIDYIIPGNDDSIRSYAFFCSVISQAIKEGQ